MKQANIWGQNTNVDHRIQNTINNGIQTPSHKSSKNKIEF